MNHYPGLTMAGTVLTIIAYIYYVAAGLAIVIGLVMSAATIKYGVSLFAYKFVGSLGLAIGAVTAGALCHGVGHGFIAFRDISITFCSRGDAERM